MQMLIFNGIIRPKCQAAIGYQEQWRSACRCPPIYDTKSCKSRKQDQKEFEFAIQVSTQNVKVTRHNKAQTVNVQ